jgi:NAD-dependent DNA ligase
MAKNNESTAILNVMALNEDTSEALRGKRVCFTGHMGMTRAEMTKFIQDHGGEVHDGIKWNTNLLVTNRDWNKGSTITEKKSSKLIKAEQQGVKVVSEKELIEIVWKYQEANPQQKASGE